MLRAYGRFLPEATAAPFAMTNYLPAVGAPSGPLWEVPAVATETEQLQRIRHTSAGAF